MQAQLGGVGNAAEPPQAPRGGVSNLVQGIRGLFGASNPGAAHAGTSKRPEITVQQVALKDAQVVTRLDRQHDALIVDTLVGKLEKTSARLMPLVYKEERLTQAEKQVLSNELRDMGAALNGLVKQVAVEGGDARHLLQIPESVANEIKHLTSSQAASGKSMDVLLGDEASRHSVLSKHELGRPVLGHFLTDAKRAVIEVARATGDEQLLKRAKALFADPEATRLTATLGTQQSRQGEYLALSSQTPRPDKSFGGARYANITMRQDNVVHLSNGKQYYAHAVETPNGIPLGTATAYPKRGDMPDFLRMLVETGKTDVLVLASRAEILESAGERSEVKHLPYYFHHSHEWGDQRVEVARQVGVRRHGDLEVKTYQLTIKGPGQAPAKVNVHNVTNWPDKQTIPEVTALALASDLRAQGIDFAKMAIHCKAGIGRTGTEMAAIGFVQDPTLEPETLIRAERAARAGHGADRRPTRHGRGDEARDAGMGLRAQPRRRRRLAAPEPARSRCARR